LTAARATPAAGHGGSAHGYGRLFAYTRPFWPVQLAAVTGMLVEAVAAGAFTWLMRPLIDGTFVDRDPGVLAWMPMVVVALFLVRGIGVFLSSYGMAYVGRRVVETLRGQTFAHLLRLPTGYYADENTARLVARLNFNAEQVADACAESLKVIVTDTLTVLALFCVMLYNSVSLTLTLVFMVPLIALVVWAAGKRFRSISRRMLGTVSDSTRVAGETLAGLDAVKVFGGAAASPAPEGQRGQIAEHGAGAADRRDRPGDPDLDRRSRCHAGHGDGGHLHFHDAGHVGDAAFAETPDHRAGYDAEGPGRS
jgi:subfamily B ATP-binding cassette protein MsbA